MKYLLFFSFTIIAFVNATSHFLAPRQEICRESSKVCGSGCIPRSYTCCPRFSGGCEPGYYCRVGSDGVGGCCRIGRVCHGPGGISTIDYEPTATYDRDPTPTDSEDPDPIDNEDSFPTADGSTVSKNSGPSNPGPTASGNDNAGTSNRLDNAVPYLVVGALVLLV